MAGASGQTGAGGPSDLGRGDGGPGNTTGGNGGSGTDEVAGGGGGGIGFAGGGGGFADDGGGGAGYGAGAGGFGEEGGGGGGSSHVFDASATNVSAVLSSLTGDGQVTILANTCPVAPAAVTAAFTG
jgi:hypothetical protein